MNIADFTWPMLFYSHRWENSLIKEINLHRDLQNLRKKERKFKMEKEGMMKGKKDLEELQIKFRGIIAVQLKLASVLTVPRDL